MVVDLHYNVSEVTQVVAIKRLKGSITYKGVGVPVTRDWTVTRREELFLRHTIQSTHNESSIVPESAYTFPKTLILASRFYM